MRLLLLCNCAEGRSTLGGLDADDVPSAVLSEELRLGSVDEPDQGFSQVRSVTVERHGHAYVLDALERYIRVYDGSGRRLRSIGGPGEGPGEFGSDRLVMGLTGDTLWVADDALRRTTIFALDGSVLATVNSAGVFETVAGISMIQRPGGLRADGRFDALLSHSIPRDPPVDTLWVPNASCSTVAGTSSIRSASIHSPSASNLIRSPSVVSGSCPSAHPTTVPSAFAPPTRAF